MTFACLDDAAQFVAQPQAQLGVEIRERLVEQQDARVVDQRTRERDALHLSAGQLRHRARGIFGEADELEHARDLLRGLVARHFAVAQRIVDVLLHRHVRPHRVGLEHHADVAQARRHVQSALGRRDLVAADRDRAAGRLFEAGDAAQGRGLAAAGGPEQHDDLARRDAEAHVVDRGAADQELLAQMRDDQFGGHSVTSTYDTH